jgi:hypothetical protein
MSDATKDALDAALAAHVADTTESNALITGYVIQAAYITIGTEDRRTTGYLTEFADDQAYHTGLGLAVHLVNLYEAGAFEEDEDD